jgi:hypothetical protein
MSVPGAILPVMETSHGATLADQLSQVPVITDADVLTRVDVIIEPEARKPLTLWVFFLNPDGTQPRTRRTARSSSPSAGTARSP